jgi:hypothetical protein
LQQRGDQPPGVAFELAAFGSGVAIAENQKIELPVRRATFVQLDQRPRWKRSVLQDELVRRIDRKRPRIAKTIPGVALPDNDPNRSRRRWKAQRFFKRPIDLLRFTGRFPLTVDRTEAARVQHPAGRLVDHLEKVLTAIRVVDRPRRVAGPLERLYDHPIEGESLFLRVAGVIKVHPHGLRRVGGLNCNGAQQR